MKKVILLITVFALAGVFGEVSAADRKNPDIPAVDQPEFFIGLSSARATRAYSYLKNEWVDHNGMSTDFFQKNPDVKDRVFAYMNTDMPVVKDVVAPDEQAVGRANESDAEVLHRTDALVIIKWQQPRDPNRVWIATIHPKYKKAIVYESFEDEGQFGVHIETLDGLDYFRKKQK